MLRIYNSAFDNILLLLTYDGWDQILVKLGHNFKWLRNPKLNPFMEQVETWFMAVVLSYWVIPLGIKRYSVFLNLSYVNSV